MRIIKCLICGKILEILHQISTDSLFENCWGDGFVAEVQAGYGSRFDCDTFILGLCDTCIQEKIDQGLLFIKKG